MERLAKRYIFSWLFVASSIQVSSLHFAQATYICTAYLNVSSVDVESNETVWRYEESGLYGLDSPKMTVTGEVYVPRPMYGCQSDDAFYDVPNDSKGWIALIQRGHGCSFSEKINLAAREGAIAVVIFNDLGIDRVIQMSHPGMWFIALGKSLFQQTLIVALRKCSQVTLPLYHSEGDRHCLKLCYD